MSARAEILVAWKGKGAAMIVFVDPDICIDCALCVKTCPAVFRMENENAVVYVSSVPKEFEDSCKRMVFECPVNAVLIVSR
jgi:ferredoxin